MSASGPATVTPPGWRCPIVRFHNPAMHYRELHHVWPKEYGGPESGPKAGICGGCHNEIHGILAKAKLNAWNITPEMHKGSAKRVVELAKLGALASQFQSAPVLPDWAVKSAA